MQTKSDGELSVQVEWLESRQEISAQDFTQFRGKTLALYQSSIRSISEESFNPSCRFSYPGLEQEGRWFGTCSNGLGVSSGYGLILDSQGHVVEFVGTAEEGKANGPGAMILRSPGETGAIYYEGSFANGVPDGVVRVEEPGRKPRVRQFNAGVDAGAADADQLPAVQF